MRSHTNGIQRLEGAADIRAWFHFPSASSVQRAAKTISFNLLHSKDHSRIKQVIYCQAEDKPVPA